MDRIIALYRSHELAVQVRTHLVADGFATDRVDVTSTRDLGRAVSMPAPDAQGKIATYFATLLSDLEDEPIANRLVSAVRDGAATVIVHPRGAVEIARARQVLQSHDPQGLFARIAPSDDQGGLLGEHAAG